MEKQFEIVGYLLIVSAVLLATLVRWKQPLARLVLLVAGGAILYSLAVGLR